MGEARGPPGAHPTSVSQGGGPKSGRLGHFLFDAQATQRARSDSDYGPRERTVPLQTTTLCLLIVSSFHCNDGKEPPDCALTADTPIISVPGLATEEDCESLAYRIIKGWGHPNWTYSCHPYQATIADGHSPITIRRPPTKDGLRGDARSRGLREGMNQRSNSPTTGSKAKNPAAPAVKREAEEDWR